MMRTDSIRWSGYDTVTLFNGASAVHQRDDAVAQRHEEIHSPVFREDEYCFSADIHEQFLLLQRQALLQQHEELE